MHVETIASRYKVLRELGRGGMGVVYLVEHVHTGDHLALKVLLGNAAMDASAVERFKREARASARIKSENVVKVVDADTAPELEGAPFLVMELLNGSDLQKQLNDHGRLSPADAYKYLSEAGRALDKSHAMGIVHRDLKPENLFLHTREDGTVILKILDFGISKLVGSEANNDMAGVGMTSTGAVMGTPLYMSPEQARGRVKEIGPTTDVWAMGLIALQLLTGEIYWRANTIAELMVQILSEPFYPPSTRWNWLPPGIDAWLARSCARDPAERFSKVSEQIEALGLVLGFRPSVALSAPQQASPLADTSAQLPGQGSAPYGSAPAISAPFAGAHTTTSAVAREGESLPRSRSGGGIVVGVVISFVALVGGGGYLLKDKLSRGGAGAGSSSTVAVDAAVSATPTKPVDTETAITPLVAIDAGALASAGAVASASAAPARASAGIHGGSRRSVDSSATPTKPASTPTSEAVPPKSDVTGAKKPYTPAGL